MKMQLEVPALRDAADTVEVLRRDGVRVYHYIAPPVVDALMFVGLGLLAIACAIALHAEGSKVAGQKGGHRGR